MPWCLDQSALARSIDQSFRWIDIRPKATVRARAEYDVGEGGGNHVRRRTTDTADQTEGAKSRDAAGNSGR